MTANKLTENKDPRRQAQAAGGFMFATWQRLSKNKIQLTPLPVSRIADNRCHRLPTTAQRLPKSLIWIKKSPRRDSNRCQSRPTVATVPVPVRTTILVAQMTHRLNIKNVRHKSKARNQFRKRSLQDAQVAMYAPPYANRAVPVTVVLRIS